jgi:hypothetical protein
MTKYMLLLFLALSIILGLVTVYISWGAYLSFMMGLLLGGMYSAYFIKTLKNDGYLTFELTEKFHNEFKTKSNG